MEIKKRKATGVLAEMLKHIDKKRLEMTRLKMEMEAAMVDRFSNLKPFETVDDIPDIPKVNDPLIYEEVIVKNLIRCGAIPKDKLEIGATYEGNCRNFEQAKWDGKVFWGKRYKFGELIDDKINHFQDDNGYDLFVPIKKVL